MTRLSGNNVQEVRSKMPQSIYDASRELGRALWSDGVVDRSLKELIRLKSADLAKCVH
jgi:hypothetical protein